MRFLELRPDGVTASFRLDPRLTLLRGLEPADRVALVGFVHSVAAGESFDWDGTVDVHGIHLRLDDMLELIGATADAALIVEASSLLSGDDDGERSPEQQALAEAEATRSGLEAAIADLADELGAAGGVRRDMKLRLTAIEADLDPESGARLDRADGELGRAARLAERPDPWTGTADPEGRVADLEALIADLDQRLTNLPEGDRSALASASATARLAVAAGPTPDPEAVALAEAWMALHQRLEGLESRVESAGGGTEAVAARLDAARAAARAAEDAAVPRAVTPEEVTELEELHDRVLALDERSGRGVRRGAARRDFEAAQQALNDALDIVGYPTWAAFRMGNGMVSVAPELIDAYDRARQELELAEIEWAELMARLERDTELQSVLNAIETALDHGVSLLGEDPYADGGDDPAILADALRSRRIDPQSLTADPDEAFRELRRQLEASQAPGVGEISADLGLIGLADTWLRVLGAADAAAVRALRDRERAAAELKELILLGSGNRVDRLDAERDAVRQIETEVAAHRDRLFEITATLTELHMLAATELAVAEEHDGRVEELDAAVAAEHAAAEAALEAAGSAAGVAAVARNIPRGDGGPVPLVVLMGAAPAAVLDVVDELPEDVQIIVVGGDDEAQALVEKLGGSCPNGAEGPAFA